MSFVWHWTDWGWEHGRVRVGTRRRWRTIGPVTIFFPSEGGYQV